MIERKEKSRRRHVADQRKPWITPIVRKIRAGEAEVGTRSAADGPFTTS